MTNIAIFSHYTRKTELEKTIAELATVGLKPDVVQVQEEAPAQYRNRRNAFAALKAAFVGNPVLVLEDDVTPAETLPAWLDYLERTEDHVVTLYGCVGKFYAGKTREMVENHGTPRTSRVEWVPATRTFYGSQALWIPASEAEAILADKLFTLHEHEPYGPWDHAIRTHLVARGRRLRITIPNVIQHRAPPSVINRPGSHKSPIFHPLPPPKE